VRILTALVVDEIRETDDGRVDLLGLREDLYFDTLPVLLKHMTLFLEFEVAPEDSGQSHRLGVRLSEANGRVLKELPLRFTVPAGFDRPTAPLNPTLFELPFEQFGLHHLDIFVAGEHARRLYLTVLPRGQ
jgi:hypothetical protein